MQASDQFQPGHEYVLGFAFSQDMNSVLLISKMTPAWQANKFNGVGGKLETYDWCTVEAMRREFLEETGIITTLEQWSLFGLHQKPARHHLDDQAYAASLFTTVLSTDQMAQLGMPTAEKPLWFDLDRMHRLQDTGVQGTLMYLTAALTHLSSPINMNIQSVNV